jgi:hypothetical protein
MGICLDVYYAACCGGGRPGVFPGSAFRVLAVAAALCCLSVCGGLSNAVGCRGRAADEAERVGFAQQEGWGRIRSLGYGCTSEA